MNNIKAVSSVSYSHWCCPDMSAGMLSLSLIFFKNKSLFPFLPVSLSLNEESFKASRRVHYVPFHQSWASVFDLSDEISYISLILINSVL